MRFLLNEPLVVGAGSNLRQVGDTKNLAVVAETAQQTSDDFGHGSADAAVDLVENERGYRRDLRGDHGNGKRNAGQFAAGGHFGERSWRGSGVP